MSDEVECAEESRDITLSDLNPNQRAYEKVIFKKFPKDRTEDSEGFDIEDEYAEAWYELGEPIFIPFIKYLISVTIFILDNFFLVKNTINAIKDKSNDLYNQPQIIATCILGMHVFSSILISIIDSLNKDAILGRRGKYLNRQHKSLILLRILAHVTLTMRLFRYTTAYLENRKRNRQLNLLRMRRVKISENEVQFVVDQKKNQLVESHYDLVDSFFKTVPAALLQVFFMFKSNPTAKLRLFTTTDMDRFTTVFVTVVTASISAALYQSDYLHYKKVLRFQECFRAGFKDKMNLKIPGNGFLASNMVFQIATIGIRMCFYSVLIFRSPIQYFIIMTIILVANYCLMFVWNKSSWRFHPVLENPLYGVPWFSFEIIDLWINLFVPGVHYSKPLDQFLNFYTTSVTGIIIFGSFDFLYPTEHKTPSFILNATTNATIIHPVGNSTAYLPDALDYLNKTISSPDSPQEPIESYFLITSIIQGILVIHDKLTFNQISYAGFFYNIVKFMNIVNVFCFLFTCTMNYIGIFDLDFPIQIVNSFYLTIFHQLNQKFIPSAHSTTVSNGEQQVFGPQPKPHGKSEIFLIYSMLRNSTFFYNVPTVNIFKISSWQTISEETLDNLTKKLIEEGVGDPSSKKENPCVKFINKIADILAPFLYPLRFCVPQANWQVPTDKESIIMSLNGHPLMLQMTKFVQDLYDNLNDDGKLLLAVFCANYNEIVRHYSSLRIEKTFGVLDIPIEKGEIFSRTRGSSANRPKLEYELGYWQRMKNVARRRRAN